MIIPRLSRFAASLSLDQIPDHVVHEARRCVLDTYGVMVAGQRAELLERVRTASRNTHGTGNSGVINHDMVLNSPGATMVNATAGHVYDFDDTSYTGIMHGSVAVLPAALATAQERNANGKLLLEAFIAGVEIEYAVAQACTESIYYRGWWTSGVYGSVGAATAAAKILGLDRQQITHALALAVVSATGMKAVFGTDAKPLGVGQVAARGVECALLAEQGIEGPIDAFENERGFLALLNDGHIKEYFLDSLGKSWRLTDPGILFKRYPVCSAAQAGAELAGILSARHGIQRRDIRHIVCEVPTLVDVSLVYPKPISAREAQFSMPFAIACVLVNDTIALEHLQQKTLESPEIRELMAKVEMIVPDSLRNDPEVQVTSPEGAGITIHLHSGEFFGDFLSRPTGMPGNPASDDLLKDKFLRCCVFGGLNEESSHRILKRIWGIELLDSIQTLDHPG